jgi:tetratricopeptide (TPR) repeat protein
VSALVAAQAKYKAGAFDAALGLVRIAESGPLDELRRAQVDVLRAQIAFAASHGDDAPPLLLKAARRLELLDVSLARETYLDALDAATFAGRLAKGGGPLEVAEAIRAAPHSQKPARAPDLLLDGFAVLITDGHRAAAPILRQALSAFRSDEVSSEESLRWLWLAYTAAGLLWDYESWDAVSAQFVQLARDAGALTVLPLALTTRAGAHLLAGEAIMAASLAHEVLAVNEAIGTNLGPYPVLTVFAFQGREAEASELIEVATKNVASRGEGRALTFIYWATAVLHNGLGRYEDAVAAAEQASEDSNAAWFRNWGFVELIEAATHCGKTQLAGDPLGRLSEITTASGSDWALGVEARSRALLSHREGAETFYRQAIEALARTRVRVELARTHLLYGEWLRRERRRLDAREQLRTARTLFTEFGMEAFAERARVELEATGEHARKRSVETRDDLTPQEAQILASRPRVLRIKKSPRGCLSAPAPSTTTSARCFASSE